MFKNRWVNEFHSFRKNPTDKSIFTRMLSSLKSGFIWLLFVFEMAARVIKMSNLCSDNNLVLVTSLLASWQNVITPVLRQLRTAVLKSVSDENWP